MRSRDHINSSSFTELTTSCDRLIRSGQIQAARTTLQALELPVPREFAQPLAHLCYRTNLFSTALKILAPFVRSTSGESVIPTSLEKATYAIALVKLGSIEEGLAILESCDRSLPEVHLYAAFAFQAQWDYARAIPNLQTYLACPNLSDYQTAVAKLNLLAALISTSNSAAARPLFDQLSKDARKNGWDLIRKNLQELSCQIAIIDSRWDEARERLRVAMAETQNDGSIWDFFLMKWQALIDAKADGRTEGLKSVRAEALQLGHWETVRECDLAVALAERDQNLFDKIYAGTPFASYRQRMVDSAASWAATPSKFDWMPFQDLPGSRLCLENLKLSSGELRGFAFLCRDFYRPQSVGNVHAQLFFREQFDPVSSPGRVANVMKRLRSRLKDQDIPLTVIQRRSHYFLKATSPVTVQIEIQDSLDIAGESSRYRRAISKLKNRFQEELFTSREASSVLDLSKTSTNRFISWALENAQLERSGQNRATLYKVSA